MIQYINTTDKVIKDKIAESKARKKMLSTNNKFSFVASKSPKKIRDLIRVHKEDAKSLNVINLTKQSVKTTVEFRRD